MNSSNNTDFVFEILCEELPHDSLNPKNGECRKVFDQISKQLISKNIKFTNSTFYFTPRRIAGLFNGISRILPVQQIIHSGPPLKFCFKDGNPTSALNGFMRKFSSFDSNHTYEFPLWREDNKDSLKESGFYQKKESAGEVVMYYEYHPEQSIRYLLGDILSEVLNNVNFEKSMYWGEKQGPFLRPICSILALLGKEVVDLTFLKLKSGNTTEGHRFLSSGKITINEASQYAEILKQHQVVVTHEERLRIILEGVDSIEESHHLKAIDKTKVANIVNALTEYPIPVLAEVNPELINIPPEVVIEEMIEHQKYFPTYEDNKQNILTNKFIFVANGIHSPEVTQGNINVLTSRLRDGIFLYKEDIKIGLSELINKSQAILFEQHLGTYKDKADRVMSIVNEMGMVCQQIKSHFLFSRSNQKPEQFKVIIDLLKCDLASNMVFEFPHLQGIMGKYYVENALNKNQQVNGLSLDQEIADAIKEHYLPMSAKGEMPASKLSIVVSIADKLDNLFGLFAIELLPTGNNDPYALRRQGYGLIRLLVENKIHISLHELAKKLEFTYNQFVIKEKPAEKYWLIKLEDFLLSRFRTYAKDHGLAVDEIEASINDSHFNFLEIFEKAKTIQKHRDYTEFHALANSLKRIEKITNNQSIDTSDIQGVNSNSNMYVEPAERKLFEMHQHITQSILSLKKSINNYSELLRLLYNYGSVLDNFFKHVYINTDNKSIKRARILLLLSIKNQILNYFNISKIQITKNNK